MRRARAEVSHQWMGMRYLVGGGESAKMQAGRAFRPAPLTTELEGRDHDGSAERDAHGACVASDVRLDDVLAMDDGLRSSCDDWGAERDGGAVVRAAIEVDDRDVEFGPTGAKERVGDVRVDDGDDDVATGN